MDQTTYLNQISEDGFAIVPQVISNNNLNDIESMFDMAHFGDSNSVKERQGDIYAIRDLLHAVPLLKTLLQEAKIRELVEPILGKEAKIVRAMFFDKTSTANWKVTWHQDITIAVKAQHDVAGFGPWSEKAGIIHGHAPASVLENMLTVRIHLDACTAENGALFVIPGSHNVGRLANSQRQALREGTPSILCPVPKQGAMVMRPLLLHASATSLYPSHRRVLHFEYSASKLPSGLEWHSLY